MELSIKKIREKFANEIGGILIKRGFKVDKSLSYYSNKYGKNKFQLYLRFYDYLPYKAEFHVIFIIWIHEIIVASQKFHEYINEDFSNKWSTFSFSEGDFYDKTKDLETKLRKSFTHIIYNEEDVLKEIDLCKDLTENRILPFLNSFINLENFQKFVKENPKEVVKYNLTKEALIALKLNKDEEDLKNFLNFVKTIDKYQSLHEKDIFKLYIDNIQAWNLA